MARPTRTTAQLKDEIVSCAAIYTMARTDWEGPRREQKKTALRRMARAMRQLCESKGHVFGFEVMMDRARLPGEVMPQFKCPVCDPSGDNKREDVPKEKRRQNSKQKEEAILLAQKFQAPSDVPPADALSEEDLEAMADEFQGRKKIEGE